MAKRSRRRPPVFLVIDTCVWLDLAKDYSQQSLLAALEDLVHMRQVQLVTPALVIEEFKRNRDRVVEDAGRSIGSTIRRAKELLAKLGDEKQRDAAIAQLNEVDQKSVNYKDAALEGVKRIEALFASCIVVKTSEEVKLRAAERALKNRAPFHRQRNSMNDAVLIELYGELQRGCGGQFVFVTHNVKDFSAAGADEKLPHPDIAKFFSIKSHCFTRLGDALNRFRPEEFRDIIIEQAWYFPPRRFVEIHGAIGKLFDQVWYNRHQVWNDKLQSREAWLIENEEERGKDPLGLRFHRGVWERAEANARRPEEKHGIGDFGPWVVGSLKHLSVLMLLGTTCALSTSPAWAWWQFVANGPNSEREISPRFRTEKECKGALKATETFMAKKFPGRYPLVGSCEEYRDAR